VTARRTDPRPPPGRLEPTPAPSPEDAPRARRAGRGWSVVERAWEHRASLLLLLVLLALVAVVHATGMTHAPPRSDDEGTYVAQAWAVQHWRTLAHYT
jgi:hypothetical protein